MSMIQADLSSAMQTAYDWVTDIIHQSDGRIYTRLRQEYGSNFTGYFPWENVPLAISVSQAVFQAANAAKLCPIETLPAEAIACILDYLEPISLAHVTAVSKAFYTASKQEFIWKNLFKRYYPDLSPSTKTALTVEQQFKILFKQIIGLRAQLKSEENALYRELSELRGPTGFDGSIDRAWKQYNTFKNSQPDKWEEENKLLMDHSDLCNRLWQIAGRDYCGTEDTIGEDSELKHFMSAIKSVEHVTKGKFESLLKVVERDHFPFRINLFLFGEIAQICGYRSCCEMVVKLPKNMFKNFIKLLNESTRR